MLRRRSVDSKRLATIQHNGTSQVGDLQGTQRGLERLGYRYESLRLQRPPNPRQDGRKPPFQQPLKLTRIGTLLERTVQDVRQKETAALKFRQHRLGRLSRYGKPRCRQYYSSVASEFAALRIEKIRIVARSDRAEQQGPYVQGPVAGRPFEALQALGDVSWRRRLPATVARQKVFRGHEAEKIVVERRRKCKRVNRTRDSREAQTERSVFPWTKANGGTRTKYSGAVGRRG
jgi:hypothetical protein